MTLDEIRSIVIEALIGVAPEIDGDLLDFDRPLEEQIEIDSLDNLNFLEALYDRLGVNVPESDYSELKSIASTAAYLLRALERS